jgi:hypothetical protein
LPNPIYSLTEQKWDAIANRNKNNKMKNNKMPQKYKVTVFSLLLFIIGGLNPQSSKSEVVVPEALNPDKDQSLAFVVAAKGVQIYECSVSEEQAGKYEWVNIAPKADLFDKNGNKIGKHYAGPHWESNDGSKVLGTVQEKVDAPVPGAVSWLLLSTESDGAKGAFSEITTIQRLNTVGGVAPATGCSQAEVGKLANSNYTADYYLFTTK